MNRGFMNISYKNKSHVYILFVDIRTHNKNIYDEFQNYCFA